MSTEEGLALAKEFGCLFFECSAKTRENVDKCFEELTQKVWFLEIMFIVNNNETRNVLKL